jgi:putative transposase
MTQARRTLISLSDTPYYHCVNRCVRRAFLCGEDRHTGRSYEHRKQWIVDKIKELSSLFAIDVCAFSVLSNHYHIVMYVDQKRALEWGDEEVVERWKRLFRGVLLVDRYMAGQCGTDAEANKALEVIGQWRELLSDISWYMRCLNEHIAREANKEDGCKGRFWEGRFKSQALLEEKALLACMAYVDLNPIRAGLSETLEGSDYTSIQERIKAYVQTRESRPEADETPSFPAESTPAVSTELGTEQESGEFAVPAAPLVDFTGATGESESGLPFHFSDYLELVDWTGRAIREDKRGFIPADVPPILTRLGVEADNWIETVRHFRRHFYGYVGPADVLAQYSQALGRNWLRGVGACRRLLGEGKAGSQATALHFHPA